MTMTTSTPAIRPRTTRPPRRCRRGSPRPRRTSRWPRHTAPRSSGSTPRRSPPRSPRGSRRCRPRSRGGRRTSCRTGCSRHPRTGSDPRTARRRRCPAARRCRRCSRRCRCTSTTTSGRYLRISFRPSEGKGGERKLRGKSCVNLQRRRSASALRHQNFADVITAVSALYALAVGAGEVSPTVASANRHGLVAGVATVGLPVAF